MQDYLKLLLEKIDMPKEYFSIFDGGNLEIRKKKETNKTNIIVTVNDNIDLKTYIELKNRLDNRYGKDTSITLSIVVLNNNYDVVKSVFLDYIDYLSKEKDNELLLMFKDLKMDVNDKTFTIYPTSKNEQKKLESLLTKLNKMYSSLGLKDVNIEVKIDEEEENEVKKIIDDARNNIASEYVPPVIVKEEEKTKWTPKKKVNYKRDGVVSIKSLDKEENSVNLEAFIFDATFDERTKKDGTPFYLVTLKISDKSSSIIAKMFAKDEEEFINLSKELKVGSWYHFTGQVREDTYAKDLVFNLRTYEPIDSLDVKRVDNASEKRVELHAHTMMSQMDGVIDESVLVKRAMDFGHAGIAITDHDGCQAFPHVFDAVTKYNKTKKKEFDSKVKDLEEEIEKLKESGSEEGIKELESMIEKVKEDKKNYKPFKTAYGVEIEMCESYLNVCFNANDEKIEGNTFVVFDTETTGFNPGLGDSLIEIGGVKVKNGEVIDRFDELINPGHHIDEAITRVTNISDDDVKDADNEENVTRRFKEWIGSLPLVAHNAKFDKNMIDMAYQKYNLGKLENPIIDTLMLSRVINRDLKKHNLAALGKFYGIDTGEADNDDEESNDIASGSIKFDDDQLNEIEDILVDGVSALTINNTEYKEMDYSTEEVIKKTKKEVYLNTIYKASKTDKCNVEVILKDGYNLIGFNPSVSLHAAENVVNVSYTTPFGEKNLSITIYVGQHHGADVDSENTGYIFNKMLKQIKGIETLKELNDLGKLEFVAINNDSKALKNIGDIVTYKDYVRRKTEEGNYGFGNPFEKYGNDEYEWLFKWCHEDNLQMYENIPGKTFTEHTASIYDSPKHVTFLAKNQTGLKNLFKLISFANTNFIQRNAKLPRRLINEYREGILVGSACQNGEIFYLAETRSDEELIEAMKFYDYIEVQPIENYEHLIKSHDISNTDHLKKCLKKIIDCAKKAGKLIVATGDVHNLDESDRLYREIIINQNVPGKGRHPFARLLSGDKKVNINADNINNAILKAKTNGWDLSKNEIKVLKYVFALSSLGDIEINSNNIATLYVVDKKASDEEINISDEEAKKYFISATLKKLQTSKVLSCDFTTGIYSLDVPFNKSKESGTGHIPNQFFRNTNEMLDSFSWLNDKELSKEIVITNTNKIIDMIDEIEVIVYPDKPFSPIIEHSQETCRDLVFEKAQSMYGKKLPRNIEERIAQEFYGDKIIGLVRAKMDSEFPDLSDEEKEEKFSSYLHEKIMCGYDAIVELKKEEVLKDEPELNDEEATKKAKLLLTGIIGGGFDVIYLIAQKLVKHSNDEGYLVGSRGSVGSSFVASMMGITECNGLPAHYYCPKCCHNEFNDEDGQPYANSYPSGFDLPNKNCPECGELMIHQGNDMPFATFLGFAGEKVPDIDLNFSGDNQASAHEYTKVLFGTDNVYRAGTIGTVADKTAFGYVQGYYEERMYDALKIETDSYGIKIPSKDELKKKGLIKSNIRTCEVERLAVGCTGVKRTTGQHPGGIVVVPGYKDVWDFTPFQYPADAPRSDDSPNWRTTHFDYHKIEADLLKLDILGHDDPTVLRMLQDLSGIDVTEIDLGDRDTMSIFTGPEILGVKKEQLRGLVKDGKKYCPTGTLGVPEFGTSFLLGMLEETKPTTFAELIKISGLSHGTDVWLGNARDLCTPDENGVIKVPFKDVIGCRDDIMVNLMAWGLPPAKAFKIMEFVRKGKASKDPEGWKEHAAYMKEHGIPEWYIESCRKIKYMFPKAHATAYVTSAFRIAWFKVHHPIWYYCAYLSIRRDQFHIESMILGEEAIRAKIDEIDEKGNAATNKDLDTRETLCLCLEMCARGFYFKNIDIEKSDGKNFVITEDGKGLIIPFRALDGLGGAVADTIVKERKIRPFMSIEDFQKRGKVSQTLVDKMRTLGVLDGMDESNQLSLF